MEAFLTSLGEKVHGIYSTFIQSTSTYIPQHYRRNNMPAATLIS